MATARATIALFAALALALALAVAGADARPCALSRESVEGAYPAFCGKFPCPPFTVNADRPGFEVRTYAPGTYVATTVKGSSYSMAYTRAVSRLYRYFNGGNYEGVSLNQTAPLFSLLLWGDDGPVVTEPAPASLSARSAAAGPGERPVDGTLKNYAFAYWLPPERQSDPPMPADDAVKIVSVPESVLFVKVFGGYAPEPQLEKQANLLSSALIADGTSAWDDGFGGLVYDGPAKIFGRHNEVAAFEVDPRSNYTALVHAIADGVSAQ